MILSKYFNKKYLYLLPILTISSMYGFNPASMKTIFLDEKIEETEKNKYEEEYKLVSLTPFYEGEKLAKEDESKYMQELKMISMQEFDDADSIKNNKEKEKISIKPKIKEINIEEKVVEVEVEKEVVKKENKIEEKVVKIEEDKKTITEVIVKTEPETQMRKELIFLSPIKNKPKEQVLRTENKEKIATKVTETTKAIAKIEPEVQRNIKKEQVVKIETSIYDILAYEQILIEVDSKTNLMNVKAKINNEYKNIQTYQVSTAKKDIEKPLGLGNISKISLKPTWYPTQSTKNSFKKRGIILPNAIPYGHKYNYMGAAKINLTHIVNGKNTYRIHGTLNEKTIGTNESAGCIRMKNDEVLELSSLLNEFSSIKSIEKIKVLLK